MRNPNLCLTHAYTLQSPLYNTTWTLSYDTILCTLYYVPPILKFYTSLQRFIISDLCIPKLLLHIYEGVFPNLSKIFISGRFFINFH